MRRHLAAAVLLLCSLPCCGPRGEETPPPPPPRQEAALPQLPEPRPPAPRGEWNLEAFLAAAAASGRDMPLTAESFRSLIERREKAAEEARLYLRSKFGQEDERVVAAFREVPREYFQYNYQSPYSFASSAYEIPAKPWAVGFGSALSDYLGQLYMTQLAQPRPSDVVLEIGTGSGYQIALLSRLVKEAYSIEIIEPLGTGVGRIFAPLGYDNVRTRVGDGYFGWPDVEGGFDTIIVTCSATFVPPDLLQQLKPGGRLIIPIGQPFKRGQVLYIYTRDLEGKVHSRKDMGVYFIPMKGAIETRAR